MRKIICVKPFAGQNRVFVETPVINKRETITEEQAEQRAMAKLLQVDPNARFLGGGETLPDRAFQAAWNRDLSVDLEKAKNVVRSKHGNLPAIDNAQSVAALKAILG